MQLVSMNTKSSDSLVLFSVLAYLLYTVIVNEHVNKCIYADANMANNTSGLKLVFIFAVYIHVLLASVLLLACK